ncbi:MAG: hypothetical protein D4S02_11715, partial [Rhodocyclaceae bacterium]
MRNVAQLGQVFTPPAVVERMLGLIRNHGRRLDPASGDGAFASRLHHCVAIELDPRHCPAGTFNMDFFAYAEEEKFDTVIAMNQLTAEHFIAFIEKKGLAIANSTLCKVNQLDRHFVRIQATKIADQLGNVRAANMVMLGAMLARKSIVSLSKMEKTIRSSFAGLPGAITK